MRVTVRVFETLALLAAVAGFIVLVYNQVGSGLM